ncbi:MAG: NAD-dependent DNA ligase LigA [Spirochaetaceae bacterium]|jgi:DNA ligase (NAD+)|nr:NAD-dependent DNA ligase LigA [Spirochaetaceae bacterium]
MENSSDFEKETRIETLERLIAAYQASYYNGEAEISDGEFDLLWDELARLRPESPILARIGADSGSFPKARHRIPMGSQDKAANPAEFRAWAEKTAAGTFLVQYKLDGASLELQYESGKLVKAITRGDGVTGDEITRNARRMKGVAAELDIPFSGGVRGEVVMTREVWKEKYAEKANCRNAANGIMRRKDGEGCEDLRLITYDAAAFGDDGFFEDEARKVAWLKERGFAVAVTVELSDVEAIIEYRRNIALARESLPVDIDGLVVKDRTTDMADLRRGRPERQIAFKFDLEVAYSILRDVEWSESGTTYTPVGVVDPVRIAGTAVQRANLNNPAMIRALGLKIGSAVSVVKRGEIIPKIEGLAPSGVLPARGERDIVFPERCETCGSALEDAGTRLFCPNQKCPKRLLHRLQKWVGVLDIRELGDKLLRQLFERGRVRRIPDFYTLSPEELADFERMGDASAAKVARHIRTKRELPLAVFIAGFDFEGVGGTIMEKVVAAGFDTLEKLRGATEEDLADVYGLGGITARIIVEGLKETVLEMDETLAAGVVTVAAPPAGNLPLKGFSFCFTGELSGMKRSEAEEKARSLGAVAKSSVGKDLSFLVTNNPTSDSSKNKKARSLGIPVIDEKDFAAILQDPSRAALYKQPPAVPAGPPSLRLF